MCGAHIKLKRVSGVQNHESVSIFLVVSPFCKVCVSPHNFFLFQQELSLYGLLRHWWMINLSHAAPLPPPPPPPSTTATATATTTIMVATREWCGRPLFFFSSSIIIISFIIHYKIPIHAMLSMPTLPHSKIKTCYPKALSSLSPILSSPNKLLLQKILVLGD